MPPAYVSLFVDLPSACSTVPSIDRSAKGECSVFLVKLFGIRCVYVIKVTLLYLTLRYLKTDLQHRFSPSSCFLCVVNIICISIYRSRLLCCLYLSLPFASERSCAHEPPSFAFLDLDFLLPREGCEPDPSSLSALDATSYLSICRCPGAGGIERSDRILWGGPESEGVCSSESSGSGEGVGAGMGTERGISL